MLGGGARLEIGNGRLRLAQTPCVLGERALQRLQARLVRRHVVLQRLVLVLQVGELALLDVSLSR